MNSIKHKILPVLCLMMCSCAAKELKDMIDANASGTMRDPFVWLELPISTQHKVVQTLPQQKPPVSPCSWAVQSVSMSARPCALLAHDNQTRVVQCSDELGSGWKVTQITAHAVVVHHQSGITKELFA